MQANSGSGFTALLRSRKGQGLLAAALALASAQALAVDWAAVKGTEVSLFYPGQMSWEKALTAGSHKGAPKIRAGQACTECHADEAVEMGKSQAEANAFAGRSSVTVEVRAAVEGGELHWQISGPAAQGAPSVAVMLGTDTIKSTTQAGCWGACHDDAPGMASDSGQDLGKYLSVSRSKNTATGGGTSVKPAAELDAALAAGQFLDLMEVSATGEVERGPVLDTFRDKPVPGAGSMRVEAGRWIAEFHRPLAAAGAGEIALASGGVYYFGVALHDPGVKKHQHLVSLAHTLAVGSGAADVVAAGGP